MLGLVIGVMAPAGVAGGTLPSTDEARAVPLCSWEDRVVVMYRNVHSAGGPFFHVYDWRLIMVDVGSWEGQAHDLGWVFADENVVASEPHDPDADYGIGDSMSVVESLARWGMAPCFFVGPSDDFAMDATDDGFQYRFEGRDLVVELGGRSRVVEGVSLLLPEVVEPPDRECVSLLVNRQYAPGQPWLDAEAVCETERARERKLDRPLQPIEKVDLELLDRLETAEFGPTIQLATQSVVLVQASADFMDFPLFVVIGKEALGREWSYLTNAAGFDAHRRGEYGGARDQFMMALWYDPSNEVARFNTACAYAQLGDVSETVFHLRHLPATAELRAKVEGDADFDGLREERVFVAFMKGLPSE